MFYDFTSFNIIEAKQATDIGDLLGGFFTMGFLYSISATNVAHELIHRVWDKKKSLYIGRHLLAFTFDTSFSIEHVYGHHRTVATREDPATARRGENLWFFIVRSTIQGFISACRYEKERLKKEKNLFFLFTTKL